MYIFLTIFSEYFYVFGDDLFSLSSERLHDCELEWCRPNTEDTGEDTEKVGVLVLIRDLGIIDSISSTDIGKSFFEEIDPFFTGDDDSSISQIDEVREDIFLIERDQDIDMSRDIGLRFTDIHIVEIESSLDDGLIFAIRDDMMTERSESRRDDIHDRVHTETSRSGDTYAETCIVHGKIIGKL